MNDDDAKDSDGVDGDDEEEESTTTFESSIRRFSNCAIEEDPANATSFLRRLSFTAMSIST